MFGYFMWALITAGVWMLFIAFLNFCEYLPYRLQNSPWTERLFGLCVPFAICMCIFWNPLVDSIREEQAKKAELPETISIGITDHNGYRHVNLAEFAKLLKEAENGEEAKPGTHVLQQQDVPEEGSVR